MSASVSDNETNGLIMPSSGTSAAISCRGRAEDFARRLHDRLKSFAYNTDSVDTVDASWSIDSLDTYGTPPNYIEIKPIIKNGYKEESNDASEFYDVDNDTRHSNLILDNDTYETASEESLHLTNGNGLIIEENGYNDVIEKTAVQAVQEEDEDIIPRIRRCSSLKSGKTPPGTPERKKIVRFADAMGLDLADVKTFVDEIPQIPNSAYLDLRNFESITNTTTSSLKSDKVLMPLFQQPSANVDFLDRIRDELVLLENAVVEDPIALAVRGTVRVRNVDFHKSVYIRYSMDRWKSFTEIGASYVENSCDGFSDRFTFLIYANMLPVGRRLEFAIRFHARGYQYWDSNKGNNYCFQCMPVTNSAPVFNAVSNTMLDEHWGASFY